MTEITIPELGESIVEATIGHWLKKPGEAVAAGEPVLEIETDKVTLEVVAPVGGVLADLRKQEGDTATVGEVVGAVEAGQGAPAVASAQPVAPAKAASVQASAAPPATTAPVPQIGPAPSTGPGPGVAASLTAPPPSVRRLAKAYHVDVETVRGTGPHGQVTREDIEAAAGGQRDGNVPRTDAAPAPVPEPEPSRAVPVAGPRAGSGPERESRERMSRRRLTIARQLLRVHQETAMLTTFNEIDMTAILAVRKERRDRFKDEHGVSLGFMSFFVSAVVGALKKFPRLNAEIQGDDMVLKQHYDIGIAVSTEEGLVVPVLRDADRLNFAEIEGAIAEMAGRARKNALTLEDLRGGTFTITNGGIFGSLFSTPILNPPQVGILGMHAIQERPVAVNGHVEVRPMMYVALSYDHRIVDGSEAVRFLVTVKHLCEDPVGLLLEG